MPLRNSSLRHELAARFAWVGDTRACAHALVRACALEFASRPERQQVLLFWRTICICSLCCALGPSGDGDVLALLALRCALHTARPQATQLQPLKHLQLVRIAGFNNLGLLLLRRLSVSSASLTPPCTPSPSCLPFLVIQLPVLPAACSPLGLAGAIQRATNRLEACVAAPLPHSFPPLSSALSVTTLTVQSRWLCRTLPRLVCAAPVMGMSS